jgi:hypothetical protein
MIAGGRTRRLLSALVVFAVLLAVGSASAQHSRRVPGPQLPRHRVTPGAHVHVRTARLCAPGYAARARAHRKHKVKRRRVFARYGLRPRRHGYAIDRLIPLGLGGSSAIRNLWPQHTYEPWGVRTKNRLELTLRRLVCSGQLSLASARHQIAANWIKAYKRYVLVVAVPPPAAPPPAPAPPAPPAPPGLTGTIRAAFYYPWFPQTWGRDLQKPFTNFKPARGPYSTDVPTVRAQIGELQYAGVKVGIASWFGPGAPTTDVNWPVLFQAAAGTGFSWAPYYEAEATSDPPAAKIAADLHYLRTTYGGSPALALMPGQRMLVFVYNADDHDSAHGCATVSRWKQAKDLLRQHYGESIYVNLKLFRGYAACADSGSIDGWHQYGPGSPVQDASRAPGDGSYSISPGFWKSGNAYGAAPFLARDRARWRADIAAMNASHAKWQLITTYNEWGEGTAIESSLGCRVSVPSGALCNWSAGGTSSALINDLHGAPPP